MNEDFLNLQNQSGGNLDEMMAKLLLDISLYTKNDSQMEEQRFKQGLENYGDIRKDNYRQYLATKEGNDQLEAIITEIREKNIDLSPITESLANIAETAVQIRDEERQERLEEKLEDSQEKEQEKSEKEKRHQEHLKVLESIREEYPVLVTALENIHEATLKNKPQEVDTKGVIESQDKGFSKMVEILSGILAEVSLQDKEIEVKEPKWYKPFSWDGIEGIKKLLEKIASKSDLPVKNGRVLVEVDRVGGGSGVIKQIGLTNETGNRINPATEEKQDAIISAIGGGGYTPRLDEGATYTYVGKAAPGSSDASAVWQIIRYPSADFSEGLYADGDANFDNVWDDRESLTYL